MRDADIKHLEALKRELAEGATFMRMSDPAEAERLSAQLKALREMLAWQTLINGWSIVQLEYPSLGAHVAAVRGPHGWSVFKRRTNKPTLWIGHGNCWQVAKHKKFFNSLEAAIKVANDLYKD